MKRLLIFLILLFSTMVLIGCKLLIDYQKKGIPWKLKLGISAIILYMITYLYMYNGIGGIVVIFLTFLLVLYICSSSK